MQEKDKETTSEIRQQFTPKHNKDSKKKKIKTKNKQNADEGELFGFFMWILLFIFCPIFIPCILCFYFTKLNELSRKQKESIEEGKNDKRNATITPTNKVDKNDDEYIKNNNNNITREEILLKPGGIDNSYVNDNNIQIEIVDDNNKDKFYINNEDNVGKKEEGINNI